jgi:hypothetical protein
MGGKRKTANMLDDDPLEEFLCVCGSGFGGGGIGPGTNWFGLGPKTGSQINRGVFAKERAAYWKNEAATTKDNYSKSDIARKEKGRAPIGNDGYPMELHHVNRSVGGPLQPQAITIG